MATRDTGWTESGEATHTVPRKRSDMQELDDHVGGERGGAQGARRTGLPASLASLRMKWLCISVPMSGYDRRTAKSELVLCPNPIHPPSLPTPGV